MGGVGGLWVEGDRVEEHVDAALHGARQRTHLQHRPLLAHVQDEAARAGRAARIAECERDGVDALAELRAFTRPIERERPVEVGAHAERDGVAILAVVGLLGHGTVRDIATRPRPDTHHLRWPSGAHPLVARCGAVGGRAHCRAIALARCFPGREFPEYHDRIASLRQSNGHFRTMLEQYIRLDGEIASMDDNVTPASDETMEAAKRRRIALKDELYKVLRTS